jgi:uncharacterized protein DUF6766
MTASVVLTVFLFQRGSAEAKEPDTPAEVDEALRSPQHHSNALWPCTYSVPQDPREVLSAGVACCWTACANVSSSGAFSVEMAQYVMPAALHCTTL